MYDFLVQVLATLVSSLIIFAANKILIKFKRISKRKLYNVLVKTFIIISYLFHIYLFVNCLKFLLESNFGFAYILMLMNLTFSLYVIVTVSISIKEFISQDCFEDEENQ